MCLIVFPVGRVCTTTNFTAAFNGHYTIFNNVSAKDAKKSGFHWSAFGNQQCSTFTEMNRNGLINRIGCLFVSRSGGGVVDNTLDYQSRGRKIDPPLLRSFG